MYPTLKLDASGNKADFVTVESRNSASSTNILSVGGSNTMETYMMVFRHIEERHQFQVLTAHSTGIRTIYSDNNVFYKPLEEVT